MPGARRGRPEDKVASGRELWTIEGTNALIRKLQNDPGLEEDARKQFIESVRSGALEKGIGTPDEILQYRPRKEVQVAKATPTVKAPEPVKQLPREHSAPITKESLAEVKEKAIKERQALVEKQTPGNCKGPTTPPSSASDTGKSFDAYQAFTSETALYPAEVGVPYTTLGLNGESAEVAGKLVSLMTKTILSSDGLAVDEKRDNLYHLNNLLRNLAKTGIEVEKFKKALRKGEKKLPPIKALSEDEKKEIAKEIGDVLWYCAQLSKTLGFKLSDIATMNVEKLSSRKARGTLHGNGDNR